jgi:hypothetical protein
LSFTNTKARTDQVLTWGSHQYEYFPKKLKEKISVQTTQINKTDHFPDDRLSSVKDFSKIGLIILIFLSVC